MSYLLVLIQTRRQHRSQGLSSSLHPLPPPPHYTLLTPLKCSFPARLGYWYVYRSQHRKPRLSFDVISTLFFPRYGKDLKKNFFQIIHFALWCILNCFFSSAAIPCLLGANCSGDNELIYKGWRTLGRPCQTQCSMNSVKIALIHQLTDNGS